MTNPEAWTLNLQQIVAAIGALISTVTPVVLGIRSVLKKRVERQRHQENLMAQALQDTTALKYENKYLKEKLDSLEAEKALLQQKIDSLQEALSELQIQHFELLTEGARKWSECSSTAVEELDRIRPLLAELVNLRAVVQGLQGEKSLSAHKKNIEHDRIPRPFTSGLSKTK